MALTGDGRGRALAALVRWRALEARAAQAGLARALRAERGAEVEAVRRTAEATAARLEVGRLGEPTGQAAGALRGWAAAAGGAVARADSARRASGETAARLEVLRGEAAAARLEVARTRAAASVAGAAAGRWRAERRRERARREAEEGPGRA